MTDRYGVDICMQVQYRQLTPCNYFFDTTTGWYHQHELACTHTHTHIRYEAERVVVPGKFERERDSDGNLVPLATPLATVHFWLNDSFV